MRRPTRFFGVVVVGFYAAFMTASALGVYPLGTGRPDIFAFPVGICLFVVGIHLATEALAARGARPARGGPADRRGWLPDWGLSHNGAKIHSKGARRLRNQYVLPRDEVLARLWRQDCTGAWRAGTRGQQ